jgi:hypothetical protein
MGLSEEDLQQEIQAAFKAQQSKKSDPDAAIADLSSQLATAINKFVTSGEVTGACATPSGPGTITGKMT